jgi:hypothetical protein
MPKKIDSQEHNSWSSLSSHRDSKDSSLMAKNSSSSSLKIALTFLWFSSTLILLLITSFYFYTYSHPPQANAKAPSKVAYEITEPKDVEGQVLGIEITDKRPFVVSDFLKKTPLEQYSSYIVEVSDKYNIDYRLIPSIAMKESGGGRAAPENSFNAWGFENGRTRWGSWEEAIDNVGKTLKTRYVDKGLTTPEQIMPIYAPPAMENGGGWAVAVNNYFQRMEKFFQSI